MPNKIRICFLDSYTLSPGDLDLTELKMLGDVQLFERTPNNQILSRAKDVDVLITNKCILTKEIIDNLPSLKLIQVAATGYNNVDLNAARKNDIMVCNISGYSTKSVAQHVFAMLLNFINQVHVYNSECKAGEWSKKQDFSYWHNPIPALNEMTFGIIGYGKIGQAVAKIASAFGLKIIVSQKYDLTSEDSNISFESQDYIFENSDILSLHVPLNDSTDKFINQSSLEKMKNNAILINTGRGGLINEDDLASALNSGKIAAALLDVLSSEPPKKTNVLVSAKNCFITPHQAWANQYARKKLLRGVIDNIKGFYNNAPLNVVS